MEKIKYIEITCITILIIIGACAYQRFGFMGHYIIFSPAGTQYLLILGVSAVFCGLGLGYRLAKSVLSSDHTSWKGVGLQFGYYISLGFMYFILLNF